MEIRIDGFRSSSDNWTRAQFASLDDLPRLSPEEQEVAEKLGLSAEAYARSRYASDLTLPELRERTQRVADLIVHWLAGRDIAAEVESVSLRTFEGKFKARVNRDRSTTVIDIDEDLVDDLLGRGLPSAEHRVERLFRAHFGVHSTAKAS